MQSGVYRHYKGGLYQVLGVGQHTETGELVVVYVSLTGVDQVGPRLRVRPLSGPEGFDTQVVFRGSKECEARFQYIGDSL